MGEQRKILGVNFTNVCPNLSDHQKLSLVRENIVTFLLHIHYVGIIYVRSNQRTLAHNKAQNTRHDIRLFYDQGTRSVSFEVKNDVFQICLILMFLYCR